jgi:hypothetical protein
MSKSSQEVILREGARDKSPSTYKNSLKLPPPTPYKALLMAKNEEFS